MVSAVTQGWEEGRWLALEVSPPPLSPSTTCVQEESEQEGDTAEFPRGCDERGVAKERRLRVVMAAGPKE